MNKIYYCNFMLNVDCSKTHCMFKVDKGECCCTTNEKFALKNTDGAPIEFENLLRTNKS